VTALLLVDMVCCTTTQVAYFVTMSMFKSKIQFRVCLQLTRLWFWWWNKAASSCRSKPTDAWVLCRGGV